jgi:MinD superfamily P-loop ATPase
MRVAVASGKGGTGKTTVAVNLALSLRGDVCLADCDVEEPNDHLFLDVKMDTQEPVELPVPVVNEEACTGCRVCVDFCEYNALAMVHTKVLVFDNLCHGCGGCTLFCPEKAISEQDKEIGVVETGTLGPLFFCHGRLNIAEALGPPVIQAVQRKIPAGVDAIVDSPPGTTCSMVQAVTASDYCILVAENTPFGYHDAKIAIEAVSNLQVPLGVIMNRSDIGASELEPYLEEHGIPVLMRIPFSEKIAAAYSRGIPFVRVLPEYREKLAAVFEHIREHIREKGE